MKEESLLLYPKQVQKLLGIGATKFYELNKLPSFPKPRNPLGKRPMYLRQEIESWINNLEIGVNHD
ncbi:helix-turn-helix transcriptional regulator [Legionella sainthelensi]|uniref:helix-turn-helix transcriptional regulator n=1 Tax=Legionella sainthelensi TaxID=28087 RepID=UPI000E203B5F|nr:AlpA family phage regulatory protein [Legionella sainthelensi]